MKVWVYPEKKWEDLGTIRFELSWEEVKPESVGNDDIDPDSDILCLFLHFKTKEAAMKKGQQIVDSYKTAYGCASVVKQVVDWFVEEDKVAEWVNCGDAEEIS